MLNLDRAFGQYLLGTQDVPGLGGGTVAPIGWDYGGLMSVGARNDYVIGGAYSAGTVIDATLTWFRNLGLPVFTDNADPDLQTLITTDNGFANLDLELWNSTFTTLYAESMSEYNDSQELHFALPVDGQYGIRVTYFGQALRRPRRGRLRAGLGRPRAWRLSPAGEPAGYGGRGARVPRPPAPQF